METGNLPDKCDNAFSLTDIEWDNNIPNSSKQTHKRQDNAEKMNFSQLCDKSFRRAGELRKHKRMHSGEMAFTCEQCGKCFKQARLLQVHQRTHTGEKPYTCTHCGKCFSTASSLQLHKRTHTGEKPYACAQCDKRFARSAQVQVHERTHTGEKPYACAQCDKRFARSHQLLIHKRTHTGEKPCACKQCGKSFSDPSARRRHEIIHTGEKRYACNQCGKCFVQAGHLQTHKRTHLTGRKFLRLMQIYDKWCFILSLKTSINQQDDPLCKFLKAYGMFPWSSPCDVTDPELFQCFKGEKWLPDDFVVCLIDHFFQFATCIFNHSGSWKSSFLVSKLINFLSSLHAKCSLQYTRVAGYYMYYYFYYFYYYFLNKVFCYCFLAFHVTQI